MNQVITCPFFRIHFYSKDSYDLAQNSIKNILYSFEFIFTSTRQSGVQVPADCYCS